MLSVPFEAYLNVPNYYTLRPNKWANPKVASTEWFDIVQKTWQIKLNEKEEEWIMVQAEGEEKI